MRNGKILFFFCLWLHLILPPRACHAQAETKTLVAYSMRVAQTRVEEAVKAGQDFRKKQPELYYMGGITKPWAVVLDAETDDWILLGERDPKCSVLTLDDWVVALRARFIYPDRDPGVTIDPRACGECVKVGKAKSCSHHEHQDVRFFGGIENTHFGQVCFEADWLMKQIVLGLTRLPLENLKIYYDLFVEQARNAGAGRTSVSSRFWFYPIVNRVNVIDDVVLLERFQMGVFTEVLYAEVDGTPVEDTDKFEHYPSEGFSRSFSENYDEAAQARDVFETLRGLTKLAALAKGLREVISPPLLGFYVTGYPLQKTKTLREVDVLRVENPEVGLEISGGVDLMALAMRIESGDADALRKLILVGRGVAGVEPLIWLLEIQTKDGQLDCVRIDPVSMDPSGVARLFCHAQFLTKKERYRAAIVLFDEIAGKCPNLRVECYFKKGIALGHLRQHAEALRCFESALKLDSTNVLLWNAKGNALTDLSHYEDALECYDRVLDMEELFLPGWYNKGVPLGLMGRYSEAIEVFDQAIHISPDCEYAWHNKGVTLMRARSYEQALECFKKVLDLNPSSSEAWNDRGGTLRNMGRLDDAISCHNKALAFAPQSVRAWTDKAGTLAQDGQYQEALECCERAIAIEPNAARAWHEKSAALVGLRQWQEALGCCEKAIAIEPNAADTWSKKGLVFSAMGRREEALECYDRSLDIAQRDDLTWSNKGVVLASLGLFQEALRCFDRALELNPERGHAWFNKAQALTEMGKLAEALSLYRGLLKASLTKRSLEKWTVRTLDRIRMLEQRISGENKRKYYGE